MSGLKKSWNGRLEAQVSCARHLIWAANLYVPNPLFDINMCGLSLPYSESNFHRIMGYINEHKNKWLTEIAAHTRG